MVRVGTSGFSYKEWCGTFYPAKIAGSAMLGYYAERLATVEINYTFRAMPRAAMLETWAAATPERFRFALKAPQRITHFARLRGAQAELEHFLEVSQTLGTRLGPFLFQLPPGFKKDLALLGDFAAQLGGRARAAFEFRDRSWLDDATFELLGQHRLALCIAESDKLATPAVKTADYAYLRLRKEAYTAAELEAWADRIAQLAGSGDEVLVFFKHEVRAPQLALAMERLLESRLKAA